LHIPNPIRPTGDGGGYFMLGAPDGVVIEVFEPGALRETVVRLLRLWRISRRFKRSTCRRGGKSCHPRMPGKLQCGLHLPYPPQQQLAGHAGLCLICRLSKALRLFR
jgi:hypothetical protein